MVFVGLGSNMGDRAARIREAIAGIANFTDTTVEQVSSLYETLPWGGVEQRAFLNAVARLKTSITPFALLHELLALEARLGRTRGTRWGPRVIDLDLLLYGDVILCTEALQIPHPRLTERAFVLVPLVEIAPTVMIGAHTAQEHLEALGGQRVAKDVVKYQEPPPT